MELGLSGLASGFDWNSLVDQLAEVERAPERRLQSEQSVLGQRNSAYGSIATQLTTLKERADALKDVSLFDGRSTRVGDSTIATATAEGATALGSYTLNITQLASSSRQLGTSNVGQPLSATNDVSSLVLSEAAFATAITAGTFTVNGAQVDIETDDTLQEVFDKISDATGGEVTASYDSSTDKITLSGSGTIVLGSATDTSNFLTVAKLTNNGTDTVASTYSLGTVAQSATLANAHLATAISDGGSGAGEFMVNGVSIRFDAATDTLTDVLGRINNSSAGVTANYDATEDRLVLTNKVTGDLGIGLTDVTGNFLAATGLSSGTLARGNNLLYTVNNGSELSSRSNTITADSSGIAGLNIMALAEGTSTIEVTSDTTTIKKAITDFISQYNKAQSLIDNYTASSTDADGKVTAGLLAGQSDTFELSSKLRGKVNAVMSGLSGTLDQLADLGIVSNGTDDTLTLSDATALDNALANNLGGVRSLFADSANGLGTTLSAYLESLVGDDGELVTRQSTLTKQISDIDTQISDMERIVLANRKQMINSFVSMEKAQAQINQQLQYLTNQFGN